MRSSTPRLASLLLVVISLGASAATADQGDTTAGFRLLWVTGSASSAGTVADTGSSVTLSSGPGLEFDWILAPLDELTVEVSLGLSAHPIGTSGGIVDGLDGGTLWRLPISVVAQYHPDVFGAFDPYVGLGVVYSLNSSSMSTEYQQWISKLGFSNDFNLVAQLGVSYALDVRWSANIDLRYMGMTTTGTFTGLDGSTLAEMSFKMDPWVVGLGFRHRY